MMSTLLLRIAGPMQSWGTQSRFDGRDTEREPSKSGVIGLLCAALGRPRAADVSDLAQLSMGVRVIRAGHVRSDFQTAGGGTNLRDDTALTGVVTADGKSRRTVLSRRAYLADADFLVALYGDDATVTACNQALAHPRWPLSLGRKSYAPSVPVRLPDDPPFGPGIVASDLRSALVTQEVWIPDDVYWKADPEQRLVLEGTDGSEVRRDVPLSFASREFIQRRVRTELFTPPPPVPVS